MTTYAELQITSNFSFLRGASHPEEMVETAAARGLKALAITDRNSLAGVVRAHVAAKRVGIQLVIGARLDLDDGPSLLCFPTDRAAYGQLTRLLTLGKRRSPKGECVLTLDDIYAHGDGQIVIAIPPKVPDTTFTDILFKLKNNFKKQFYLAVKHTYNGDDFFNLEILSTLAKHCQIPLVATNDVHAHEAARRPLQDVLTCIRERCTIHQAGYRLFANAERHLKAPEEMARLFRDYPDAIARTVEIANACPFNLDELRYEYPVDPVPEGRSPQEELSHLTWTGARNRYPKGVPRKVEAQIEHELALIDELGYAPYFLTVHDIVRFARQRDILCQGRGSAANSVVCFCLGITAVDPERIEVLFERFVSAERDEPPDIDVDFEHERREEVIQYIYEKYGRDRAAMTATVITYRPKSAIREASKALGLSEDAAVALQGVAWRRAWGEVTPAHITEAGLDPDNHTVRLVMNLAGTLLGFPRHLSQHTGGMVMTKGPLDEVVPIDNAAMEGRTVIEWDKNDLDALGILKVDVLGLGMLTCIRKAFGLIEYHHGRTLTLATLPPEDTTVYDMLCQADSIGVFQVESRAQMSMLPRLKPREFYDLVIEVAIVRPGPIQGDMVHPYLRRRSGEETVKYPSAELEQVLGKTLGVPLFQEQAMRIAIVAAGFTPAESDALRRAMATFRRHGEIHGFREKLIEGMVERGYERTFAERCFREIEGFADYGFPESHAASFALLVYVSAWLKCHYPAVFACALLNSQPMGFYAPAQIIRDAREHGVTVRPVDINHSTWDCTLEEIGGTMALRLGFRHIKGATTKNTDVLVAARGEGYDSVMDFAQRTALGKAALETLAQADAFGSLGLSRRQVLWAARGMEDTALPLFAAAGVHLGDGETMIRLPAMTAGQRVAEDYRSFRLSLKAHPLGLLRSNLVTNNFFPCARLAAIRHGGNTRIAGLVTARQRPGSANGVLFITIEDESETANLIVWPTVFERFRKAILGTTLLGVQGTVQREGLVVHVIVERVYDLSALLDRLDDDAVNPSKGRSTLHIPARDFH